MKFKNLINKDLSIKIVFKIKHVIGLFFFIFLVSYFFWEIYWYYKVGFNFIKWHSHIFFTILFSLLLSLPVLGYFVFLKKTNINTAIGWAVSFLLFSFLLELTLIFTGVNKNYVEKRNGYYQSPYNQNMGNYYNKNEANKEYKLKSSEFEFARFSNSLGYSDKEWALEKPENKKRVLAIGDSFTEGDGSPYDSTYPYLLNILLDTNYFEVLNAGICGSDPLFGYKNFTDILLSFNPDVVLQTVSSDDLFFDIPLRGGFERFKKDKKLKLKKGPSWEIIAATSYFYRWVLEIFGFDVNKPYLGNKNNNVDNLNALLTDLVIKYDSVANENKVKVVWIIKPLKHEFKDNKYVFNYSEFKNTTSNFTNTEIIDLLPFYHQYSIDSNKPYSHYYWEIDGHHNAKGYYMMAGILKNEILKIDKN
jgi:hypothetical protein